MPGLLDQQTFHVGDAATPISRVSAQTCQTIRICNFPLEPLSLLFSHQIRLSRYICNIYHSNEHSLQSPQIYPRMELDSCTNAVVNPSFESGSLYPWVPSTINVAKVSNGTSAYSGNYYLSVLLSRILLFFFNENHLADAKSSDLQTAVGNRGNTISQSLKHLEPRAKYTFSASIQAPSPSGFEYCSVYVYMGRNATTGQIASTQLFTFGEWTSVTGTYSPRRSEETLNIIASCDSEDSSVTGHVWIDDVILSGGHNCGVLLN